MKKIISILAVITLLCTLIPMSVMAAGTAVLAPESLEDVLLYEENFNTNSHHGESFASDQKSKETITYVEGVAVIKNDGVAATPGTPYRSVVYNVTNYYKPSGDYLKISYDLGIEDFDDVESGVTLLAPHFGTANLDGNGSWRFGHTYPVFKVKDEDVEGNLVKNIYFGDVLFDTTKMNTMTYFLNFSTHTFEAYINGTKLATTYTFSDDFTEFDKLELSTENKTDAIVKFDNLQIVDNPAEKSAMAVIAQNFELLISEENTVAFSVVIPKGFGSAKVYIDGAEMDVEINEVEGAAHNTYNVVAEVPDGVSYGKRIIKVVAGEQQIEKEVNIKANEYYINRYTHDFGMNTYYGMALNKMTTTTLSEDKSTICFTGGGDFRFANFGLFTDGVYEASFKVKSANMDKVGTFQLRMTYDTGAGAGVKYSGADYSNYYRFIRTDSGNVIRCGEFLNNEWNDVKLRVDYLNSKYEVNLNGETVNKGTLRLVDKDLTCNGVTRLDFNGAGFDEVYMKDIQLNQVITPPTVESVKVGYIGGAEKDFGGVALPSAGIEKFYFSMRKDADLNAADITSEKVGIYDENDEKIDADFSILGDVITATYKGEDVLPAGEYTFKINKGVIDNGRVLGASVSKAFELSNESAILFPYDGATTEGGNITLSAYAKDADKVKIYIDEQFVDEIATTADGLYKKEYEVAEGEHTFDVYIVCGSDVELITSKFVCDTEYARKGYSEYNRSGAIDVGRSKDITESTKRFPGRVVFEVDLTIPEKGDRVYFELGAATKYDYVYGGDGYKTLVDAIGYGNDANALFNENGTISNTGIAYPINEEFTLKYVCDVDTDTYEVYINGELVATKVSTPKTKEEGSMPLANMAIVGCKVRLTHKDINGNGAGAPIVGAAKVRTWQEFVPAAITEVACNGEAIATENRYVVAEGSEDITLTFDKAYTALNNTLVTVLVNGVAKEAGISYSKEAKTLTISNLERKVGDVVKIAISKDATMDVDSVELVDGKNAQQTVAAAIGTGAEVVIYTKDANGLWINSLASDKNSDKVTVYSKYINDGDAKEANMLLGTWASANRYSSVDYKGVTFDAATTGLVSISGTVGAKWNANLWDANYQALTESIGE